MSALGALLLALLLAATGIARDVDPGLTAIAEERVVEISACEPEACFSHDGRRAGTWEVLAWNSGYADPVGRIVTQWRGSPGHWSILTDATFGRIGCAVRQVVEKVYAVCVLAPGAIDAEPNSRGEDQDPSSAPSTGATPPPPAPLLPDAAMAAP